MLTRISMVPYLLPTSSKAFFTSAASLRLGQIPSTTAFGYFSLKVVTALSAVSWRLAQRTTLAPSLKKASTVAKPIPRLPPVTIATLFFNLIKKPPH